MSYQEQSDLYRDSTKRGRIESCAREQAQLTFAGAGGPDGALAAGVMSGVHQDLDALVAAIYHGPNWAAVDADADLLAAMQQAWPVVASARYPGGA